EGTILTVARAAADGARAASDGGEAGAAVGAAHRAAREALEQTPSQLEQLQTAGVVDAGGRALVAILEATEHVVTGQSAGPGTTSARPSHGTAPSMPT